MSRLASLLVALAVLLTGCGTAMGPAPDSPTPTERAVTPRPLPDPPSRLSADRVERFVRNRERARVHNGRLDHGPPGALGCEARFDRWSIGGYYGVAVCRAAGESGGAAPPAVYRVTTRTVERVPLAETERRRPYYGPAGSPTLAAPRALALANFAAENATLAVRIEYRPSTPGPDETSTANGTATPTDAGEVVLAETYDLEAGEGLRVAGVTSRPGAYRVTVTDESGRVARARWSVGPADPAVDLGVYVTPSGRLSVAPVPL